MKGKSPKIISKFLDKYWILIIAFMLLLALFPFFWVLSGSFKSTGEVHFTFPPSILPHTLTWENYIYVWKDRPFTLYMANTLKIAILATFLTMIASSLAAYACARIRFSKKILILIVILIAQMFPGPSIIIPIFSIVKRMGLYNSHLVLIVLYAAFSIPFSTWMLYGYFRKIPQEIEDAAKVDGCSITGVFFRIVLPVAKPGLAAVGSFAFLVSWNEFLFALILLGTQERFTLSVGLARFVTELATYYNHMSAGSVITAIPMLVVFFLLSKHLVGGLTAGAVKE